MVVYRTMPPHLTYGPAALYEKSTRDWVINIVNDMFRLQLH